MKLMKTRRKKKEKENVTQMEIPNVREVVVDSCTGADEDRLTPLRPAQPRPAPPHLPYPKDYLYP